MSLLAAANRRHYRRHPLQLILALLGVALGVAMVVSVDLAAKSTHRAFALSMAALTGRYTHHLTGGPEGLPESLFTRLRVEAGVWESAPAIEGVVTLERIPLRLIGFDVFSEQNLKSRFVRVAEGSEGRRLLTDPSTVLISKVTAHRLGMTPGTTLSVSVDGRLETIQLVGYAEGSGKPDPALEGLILADLATAQEILGREGVLDRIDLILPEGEDGAERLRRLLPAGVELSEAAGRQSATQNMTAAFELNLRAMSLLALLVGSFLIYNTMAFSVLQRRELLASLRVLGATRGQLLNEILIEASLIGFLGGLMGLGLGLGVAQALLAMVTRTINDLYFVLSVQAFQLDPWVLGVGLLLGMGIAVVAALGPAIEAATTPPILTRARSGAETLTRRFLPWLGVGGLILGVLAALLLTNEGPGLVTAISGVFFLLLGYGLLTPWLLHLAASRAGRESRSGLWLFGLAVRGISATLSRSGLAIAALTIAIAVSIGVGTMIGSFRGTVAEWLEQILQADLYLAMPQTSPRVSPVLPEGLDREIRTIPGVAKISTGRRVLVSTAFGESEVLALDPPDLDRPGFRFQGNEAAALWARFPKLPGVFISEPYAHRHRLKVGDPLPIQTDRGEVSLPVEGIFFDYRSDQGLIVLHQQLYERLWTDRAKTSLGLTLAPGVSLESVRVAIDQRLAERQIALVVRSNREIREVSLETFERTFAITQVLRLLAVAVAFVGIVSALLSLQVERRRELAVLRATGLTPREVGSLVLLQTGFMGLMAGLMAIPLGTLVALALVRVINLRSFGWTMDLIVSPKDLGVAVIFALLAALLAGLYPAWLAARSIPASGLREE